MKQIALILFFALTASAQIYIFPPPSGGGGTGESLPSQAGNAGKFLGTDGTSAAWIAIAAASAGVDVSAATSATITHNYGSKDVGAWCRDASDNSVMAGTITNSTVNTITLTFSPAFTGRCWAQPSYIAGGGGGGSMVYPDAGVPNSTGSAWGTSYSVGTGANNLVQLDSSSRLPPVSGALVTSLSASALASGTVPPARLGSGTADSTVFLRGDGTWASVGGGSGGGTVAGTGLLGTGTPEDPFRVNPATVPTRISNTASLSFSTFGGLGNCEEQNITLSGAATGDVPTIGLPSAFPAGVIVGAVYVSSANTVTLKLCRLAGTNTISSQTFTAQIVRSF